MEPVIPVAQESRKNQSYKALTIFLAVIVSLQVLVAIASHWKVFSASNKVLAVLLMLNLVLAPPLIRLRKKGNDLGPDGLIQSGYICLMLTVILFAS